MKSKKFATIVAIVIIIFTTAIVFTHTSLLFGTKKIKLNKKTSENIEKTAWVQPTPTTPLPSATDSPRSEKPTTMTSGNNSTTKDWTPYTPTWIYHVPPNAANYGDRHTYADNVFHLWVLATDQSTFPGRDGGPRSEVRVRDEYTSGIRQWTGNIKVMPGTEKVSVFQIFAEIPFQIRVVNGQYSVGGVGIADVTFGRYQNVKTIHNVQAKEVKIYIDGVLKRTQPITDGTGARNVYYYKFGPYGRPGMGAKNEIYVTNVTYHMK